MNASRRRNALPLRIETIETHAAGEPLRIITSGFPPLPGDSILAKRRYAQKHLDHLRRALMWEPRGHADMYGALLTAPERKDSHLGVLFLHNQGFSTMCGHGIIALTTAVLETKIIRTSASRPELRIDTPAGQVTARARIARGRVQEVSFINVPSFVHSSGAVIHLPEHGRLRCDVAFGGAFYVFCRARDLGLRLVPDEFRRIIDLGQKIKAAAMRSLKVVHPLATDLSFLYGTIIVGPAHDPRHHSRNVCVFADGEVDRSPTGTGVSARAAIHYARRELAQGRPFIVESIIGTCFKGRVIAETAVGPYAAVIPEVAGSASVVGRATWFIDPREPGSRGFLLR